MRSNRIGPMMQCPVCGEDCVRSAHELTESLATVFSPCPDCTGRTLDKQVPPPDLTPRDRCACGKRFIDEVYLHLYAIMVEEGQLSREDPLKDAGIPLVHPGFAMVNPPYLPARSLVLLTDHADERTAGRLFRDVPEVRGVVKRGDFVPGIPDLDLAKRPQTYGLLAGCDVRASVFFTQHAPIVVYSQQSLIHIEFPRGYDPKVVAVGVRLRRDLPRVFVDASCGVGTLGILGAVSGVPRVVLNDAWYAAAFWAAHNLRVNAEHMLVDEVHILETYEEMQAHPVVRDPVLVAEAEGDQDIRVYQGDFRRLHQVIPREKGILAVLDLFQKGDPAVNRQLQQEWREQVGGDVFIP